MEDIKDTQSQENSNEQQAVDFAHTDQLAACKKEADDWKEKYMRVQADLDNFSRRVDKERIQWRVSGQAAIITDLLEIVDDFDRAFEQLNKASLSTDAQSWITGFEFIRKAFNKFLDKHEVAPIPTTGMLDTRYHEALMEVESPDHKSGEIVAVLQKGYTFKGQVLRVAKVSIAK